MGVFSLCFFGYLSVLNEEQKEMLQMLVDPTAKFFEVCHSLSTVQGAASWENQQCGFRTGPTQTGLYSHRKELEA